MIGGQPEPNISIMIERGWRNPHRAMCRSRGRVLARDGSRGILEGWETAERLGSRHVGG